jgi:hypothetical protein
MADEAAAALVNQGLLDKVRIDHQGSGLLMLLPLVKALLRLQPTAAIAVAQLKKSLLLLGAKSPGADTSQYGNDHWAGLRPERLLTLLNHVRRVQTMSQRLQSDVESIEELLPLVQLERKGTFQDLMDTEGRGTAAAAESQEAEEPMQAASAHAPCPAKGLQVQLGLQGEALSTLDTGEAKDTKALTGSRFHLMYCKRNNSFGIKDKAQGKQVLSICKKAWPKARLLQLTAQALGSLKKGKDIEWVRLLVKHKLQD